MSDLEKNAARLGCLHCPSIILQPGVGTLETTSFELPHIHKKSEEDSQTELVTQCWMVSDMFHFENVGFSKTVGNFKYLTCADCELGPIGWHVLDTKLNYVAIQRVKQFES